jgi:Transcription factor Pcc1
MELLYPYTCEMEIVLPESSRTTMATDLMRILSVDKEIGRCVVRTFSVRHPERHRNAALVVHFAATEAKLLRVSVSSFTEYLNVALHCYQEFDPIPSTTTATTTSTRATRPMESL